MMDKNPLELEKKYNPWPIEVKPKVLKNVIRQLLRRSGYGN
jgi:hypothetical protein